MLSKFLINQSDEMLLGIMSLADPVWKNMHPENQKIAIQMFRRARFQTTPRYDLFKNTITCGNHSIRFKDPDWSTLPSALIAEIMTYCIHVPRHVKHFGNIKFDYPFAERCSGGHIVDGMRVFYRLKHDILSRYFDCDIKNLCEIQFFFRGDLNTRQSFEIQRVIVLKWNRIVRNSLLANTDMFHEQPSRTIEEARAIVGIPDGVVVSDRLETVLRRTKHIGAYAYEWHDAGHPTIRYSGMCKGVFVSLSQPLPTDSRYDFLFYKFGINAIDQTRTHHTAFPVKDLMADANYQFRLREGALVKGRNGVHAPMMFPIPGAVTYNATRERFNHSHVWTGRMRFYRTWQSEYRDLETGETGFIKQGNMYRANMRDLCAMFVKDLGNAGHVKQVPLYCHKHKEWVSYATILDQIFIRVTKTRGALSSNPSFDAVSAMSRIHPTENYTYAWL